MSGSAVPRLSVILPTFERPALLAKAYQSLRAQTFQDFEILIVDDASRDDTPQKIAELAAIDGRVHGLRLERNGGPGAARNFALNACRGELVALLDDDDVAMPERFARQVALLDSRPEVDFTVSTVGWTDERGDVFQVRPGVIRRGELPDEPQALFTYLALDGNYLPTSAMMARRQALVEAYFLEGVRAGEDWFFFLQLAALGRRLATLPEPLVLVMRGRGHASLMSDKPRAFEDQRRVLRALEPWLAERRRDQLGLLRPALAHQYLREARFWGGWRGFALLLRASALAPRAPRVRETWGFFAKIGRDKLRRLLRLA